MKKNGVFETERLFCDVYCFEAGQAQSVHTHEGSDKVYFVLEGRGLFHVGGGAAGTRQGRGGAGAVGRAPRRGEPRAGAVEAAGAHGPAPEPLRTLWTSDKQSGHSCTTRNNGAPKRHSRGSGNPGVAEGRGL